ncbi:MAG: hypothetical protein R2844_20195 [Caldilineales bacterium]
MTPTVAGRASFRRIGLFAILAVLLVLLLAAPSSAQDGNLVYVLTFDGPVNPILSSYIERAIAQADADGAEAIVLRLDTPGGQVDLTQDIVKAMRLAGADHRLCLAHRRWRIGRDVHHPGGPCRSHG